MQHRPSKQFLIRGGIASGIVALVLIAQTTWVRELFTFKKKFSVDTTTALTVGDVAFKDSNGNGIADWEERLWGLDPAELYTNGVPNKTIITQKKEALGIALPATEEKENETDQLARQLFSITTALSQNEAVDDGVFGDIAKDFGANIETKTISNTYNLHDIKTVPTNYNSLVAYSAAFRTIFAKYSTGQEDVTIIISSLETEDYSRLAELAPIAASYRSLAKELSLLRVPVGVLQYHLDIINALAGIADSFSYITQLQNNGLEALSGIGAYHTYNLRGQEALYNMHSYLVRYGILE